jgi:purine-binding chemotaxis protein CheW
MKKDETIKIILFRLSGKSWGIKFKDIQEVIEVKEVTPVPKTPSFILGIINQRGNILTVIDLDLFTGQIPGKEGRYSKILHLNNDKMDIGLFIRSAIVMEQMLAKLVNTGSPLKKIISEKDFLIGRKVTLKNKTEINLLDGDKIIDILDTIPFNQNA